MLPENLSRRIVRRRQWSVKLGLRSTNTIEERKMNIIVCIGVKKG